MRYSFIFLIAIFFSTVLNAQDYRLNDFIVKFEDGIVINYNESTVSFGIPSVDALNQLYGVTSAEKVFRRDFNNSYSQWYILYLSEDRTDILNIIADYHDDNNVELAEPDYLLEFLNETDLIPIRIFK